MSPATSLYQRGSEEVSRPDTHKTPITLTVTFQNSILKKKYFYENTLVFTTVVFFLKKKKSTLIMKKISANPKLGGIHPDNSANTSLDCQGKVIKDKVRLRLSQTKDSRRPDN